MSKSDDLISRQVAVDVAVQSLVDWDGMFRQEANCRIRDAINELPSADRPQGVWVFHKDNMPHVRWTRWECDQCHNRTEFISDYCPNCGAYMGGKDNE